MKLTKHAKLRWKERFPSLDLYDEWFRAGRVGKKTRHRIRAQCPQHAHECRGIFKGKYYRLGPNGVVFVVAPPETVVTVFPLEN